jgi:hypothetical protein
MPWVTVKGFPWWPHFRDFCLTISPMCRYYFYFCLDLSYFPAINAWDVIALVKS